MMKVTFVHHSCFVVELDETILVFDYFPPEAVEQVHFHGKMPQLDPNKQIYVFASHSHKDHFSLEVLKWADTFPHIMYVLSKDIRLGRNYLLRHDIDPSIKKRIRFVAPLEKYTIGSIEVETMRSTDEGVAFLVTAEGQNIYHAGDLHWWNWGERGELYCEAIGSAYKKEIKRVAKHHIDVAFVVLDGRMKEGYAFGMNYFLEHVDVDMVFPMHMWQEYDLIKRLKRQPQLSKLADKVVDIDKENIIFDIQS